jgi:hypothetical protein
MPLLLLLLLLQLYRQPPGKGKACPPAAAGNLWRGLNAE